MEFQRERDGANIESIGRRSHVVGGLLLLSTLMASVVLTACAVTPANSPSAPQPSVADASDVYTGGGPVTLDSNDEQSISEGAHPLPVGLGELFIHEEQGIPKNSLAIFPTIKLGSQSVSLPIPGGDVRWSSTNYGVVMYVPEAEHIDIMSTTSSKSYSKSYIYGLTVGGRLYSVRVATDVNRKSITELDPRTGDSLGSCSFYTADKYGGFAIVGDAVYYRAKIRTDLYGKRSGGGELMTSRFPCSGEPTSLQNYGTDANRGQLFGVGDRLIRIAFLSDGTYEIREIDKSTGEIERVVDTVFKEYLYVFAGDDALYWHEASGAGSSTILRHDLNGAAEKIFTLPYSADSMYGLGIDEEDGKVLVVFAEGSRGPRHFYIYDIAEDGLEELAIDPSLFSTYTRGNGQFTFVR